MKYLLKCLLEYVLFLVKFGTCCFDFPTVASNFALLDGMVLMEWGSRIGAVAMENGIGNW